jgi:transposase
MTSTEKRDLISKGHQNGMSVREMARVYFLPERTIRGLLQHERKTGSMQPITSRWGRPPALDTAGYERVKALIEKQPDITLQEIKDTLGLSLSLSALCRIIKYKMGFNYKKKACMRVSGIGSRPKKTGRPS